MSAQRAQAYALLATLLNRLPDLRLVRNMCTAGSGTLHDCAINGQALPGMETGLQTFLGFIGDAAGRIDTDVQNELAADWTCLFRGVSPTYGPQPPYEGLYRPEIGTHVEVLQMVSRTYRNMEVIPEDHGADRVDYLGTELGVLSVLSMREAEAREQGKEQEALRYADLSDQFLSNHLCRWVGDFIEQAHRFVGTDFYRGVLQMIDSCCADRQSAR